MRFLPTKLAVGAAVVICAAAASVPAASASTPSTLADIKAKAAAAISLRDSALQAALSSYQSNPYLTAADRSAVINTLSADLSGLNALAPVIQADTTVTKALADYRTVFTNFRVFVLALPQSRFAASADDLTGTVVPRLTDAENHLQALLAGPDSGKNTPPVQAAMADLAKQISGISASTNGLASAVLGYTPAEWNANPTILAQPKADLITARSDARTARHDIATVVEALR